MSFLLEVIVALKIVSLSPSITDLIVDLRYGDSLLGVTDYCEVPDSLKIKRVGGWVNPNLEVIASLKPDLLLVTDAQFKLIGDKLKRLNIPIEILPSQSIEDIIFSIEKLGDILNVERRADSLRRFLEDTLMAVKKLTQNLKRPGVIIVGGRAPGTLRNIYVAGSKTFLSELIDITGGRNLADSLGRGYFILSKETLFKLNPDIIIDLTGDDLKPYEKLKGVKAVESKRIYSVNANILAHPSTKIVRALSLLLELIHPELFK